MNLLAMGTPDLDIPDTLLPQHVSESFDERIGYPLRSPDDHGLRVFRNLPVMRKKKIRKLVECPDLFS